jgi:hypothetical protein
MVEAPTTILVGIFEPKTAHSTPTNNFINNNFLQTLMTPAQPYKYEQQIRSKIESLKEARALFDEIHHEKNERSVTYTGLIEGTNARIIFRMLQNTTPKYFIQAQTQEDLNQVSKAIRKQRSELEAQTFITPHPTGRSLFEIYGQQPQQK